MSDGSDLNEKLGYTLSKNDYSNAWVPREKGRIDIGIFDKTSKKCIIIENKINNATDQLMQLDRYIEYAINLNYTVEAVLYLSIEGYKNAPTVKFKKEVVRNIAAFKNQDYDLINGWLEVCRKGECKESSKSFIHQYIILIMDLSNKTFDNTIKKDFYRLISKNNSIDTVKVITELYHSMTEYRTDLFYDAITTDYPFTVRARWKPDFMVIEGFVENGNSHKLHISFHEDGSAKLEFWIPSKDNVEGYQILTNKLNDMGILSEFENSNIHSGYLKIFSISDVYKSIDEVDRGIANFVIKFKEMLIIK